MAGKLGVVGVNVDRLGESAEADQQNADEPQSSEGPFFQRFVKNFYQSRSPGYTDTLEMGCGGEMGGLPGKRHLAVGI